MPTYEYRCDCGNEFEQWRTLEDRRTCDCPSCGDLAIKKLSIPQKKVYTLPLIDRLPKGSCEIEARKNKAWIEEQMLTGEVTVDTSTCLPELMPDPKVKTLH